MDVENIMKDEAGHMKDARRVTLAVSIGGHDASDYVNPSLLEFSFTDNAGGKADGVQLTLHDREGRWAGPWRPRKGTAVEAHITVRDWEREGHTATLPCGTFTTDEVEFSGPPDRVTIRAVTSALTSGLREEAKTHAWENFSLKGIAGQIAGENGLTLLYDGPEYSFARQDQREESDLAFLQRLAAPRGMACKIHNRKLALYSEADADADAPVLTIPKEGGMYSPASYSFTSSSSGTEYTQANVTYADPGSGVSYTAEIQIPHTGSAAHNQIEGGGQDGEQGRIVAATRDVPPPVSGAGSEARSVQPGKVLQINSRVESPADALTQGVAKLRNKNKNATTGRLEFMGNPSVAAGVVIGLTGFGSLDGHWFVESCEHRIGSGYRTSVEIRKILPYGSYTECNGTVSVAGCRATAGEVSVL